MASAMAIVFGSINHDFRSAAFAFPIGGGFGLILFGSIAAAEMGAGYWLLRGYRSWGHFRVALFRHPQITSMLMAFTASHIVAIIFFAFSGFDFWFFVWSAIFPAFTFWTVPFAAGIGLTSRLMPEKNKMLCLVIAFPCGIAAGLAWTFFVATVLGMFFGGFIFPPLYPWIAGAIAGLLTVIVCPSAQVRGFEVIPPNRTAEPNAALDSFALQHDRKE